VAIGAVAATTTSLLLGTGICLVVERDPITLAKEVASVDFVSNGRFIFGIGGGWNEEEMENHGTDPKARWRLLRERVMAMKEIWTADEGEYHGKMVDFEPIWSWPKPIQKPHPPIYVGGDGEHTLRRVVEYGDAWMPIPGRNARPLGERIQDLQQMAKARGRGPIPVSVFGAQPRPEVVSHYAEIGVDRCVFFLPPVVEADALLLLDRYAELTRTYATAGA
jgi:probable F420-dependent oxidoreductase